MSPLWGWALIWVGTIWMIPVKTEKREPIGQNLIILLIDGYGAALLNRTKPEALIGMQALSENGVQAEYLRSVFPTHSWPNWMSLVTGLYTENHRFTADYMWSNEKDVGFQRGTGPNDTDDLWWQDLPTPLWYTAGRKNIDVNCYWFAHCHRGFGDLLVLVPPKRHIDLSNPDQTTDLGEQFPEIVKKIFKIQPYKQQLFLLRYSKLATAIETHGYGSDEVEEAISRIDLHIHDLQKQLDEQGLFASTNLIVLSDHGLGQVNEEEQYFLEECLADYSKVQRIVNSHGMVMVFTDPEDEDTIFYELKVCDQWAPTGDYDDTEAPPVSVYRAADIPESLRWADSRFMSPIVLITKPGTTIVSRELPSLPVEVSTTVKAVGGWEPESNDMRGIFLARGPAFKTNEKYGPIDMVDVYQVALNILGIEPPHAHNGTWSQVESMLTEGWEERPNSENLNSSTPTSAHLLFIFSLFLCLMRNR
ncbi:unnamed protein product, partial [Mesorhabditis belari]|uniref:Uncharacterized protein n=1 Tax=Mesorhabditis belari TaxID=2138241 RepID=A0AAF3FPH0_9BILA